MKIVNLSVTNNATTPLPFNLQAYLIALQNYLDDHVTPIWHAPVNIEEATGLVAPDSVTWNLVIADTTDQTSNLGYHTVINGVPTAKAFVTSAAAANVPLSAVISRAVAEMLVNPSGSLTVTAPDGAIRSVEIGEAVSTTYFNVNGFQMADFTYPSYFQPYYGNATGKFDYCNVLTGPVGSVK